MVKCKQCRYWIRANMKHAPDSGHCWFPDLSEAQYNPFPWLPDGRMVAIVRGESETCEKGEVRRGD